MATEVRLGTSSRRSRAVAAVLVIAVLLAFVLSWFQGSRPSLPVPVEIAERPEPIEAAPQEARRPAAPARTALRQHGDVECELSHGVRPSASLMELDPDTEEQLGWVPLTGEGTWVRFQPRNEAGLGWLRTGEHKPVPIAWAEGACISWVELTPLPRATVRGVVEGGLESAAWVVATCGPRLATFTDPDGHFRLDIPVEEDVTSCPIYATENLGPRMRDTEKIRVDLLAGQLTEVVLTYPSFGEAGWALYGDGRSVRIVHVDPDGPADRGGLTTADRIVEVDEQPVAELEMDIGSLENLELPASVTVDSPDGVRTVALTP